MISFGLLVVLLLNAISNNNCESVDKQTLVLVDDFLIKETHSIFFNSLKSRGHILTFKSVEESSLKIFQYGELLYQNLIIFSPKVEEFGGQIDRKTILDFVDAGGNLMIALGTKPSPLLRQIAADCGIEVDNPGPSPTGSLVIDHFNYDKSDSTHTLLTLNADNVIDSPVIVGQKITSPLLYKGIGLLVNTSNPLILKLLSGYTTSYSSDPLANIEKTPVVSGKETTLIAGVQTRNNARVLISGSINFFSDESIISKVNTVDGQKHDSSSNRQVTENLGKWLLKETGVIRVKSVAHHRLHEVEAPSDYTIMNMVVYEMELEFKEGDKWKPFNTRDLQLEFVRIDPFIRTIVPLVGEGKYQVVFKIPDVYGVFKFLVDYKRIGYTTLFSSTQVSVRPLKHTEYERFISSAYPYYISAFSMMFGVFIFSIVFLHADSDKNKSD